MGAALRTAAFVVRGAPGLVARTVATRPVSATLAAGSIVFSVAPPPVLAAGNAPHFNGIIYTLDLMLPVVNLGQRYAFNPGGPEQWLSYFLIAAGWTLATTVAAGLARVLRRG